MRHALALLSMALLAGCPRAPDPSHGDATRFPGQVSAGGGTSGAVIGAASAAAPAASRQAGTPGIPKGAEGNTGGTALGGTVAHTTAASAPASAASAAEAEAANQKRLLDERMTQVAARWRARAASEGWPVNR